MGIDALKTELLVAAVIAAANRTGTPAVLEKRGDAARGAILVRVNRYGAGTSPAAQAVQCRVEARRLDPATGDYQWQALSSKTGDAWMGQAEADALIARQLDFDPDCWVVAFECSDDTAADNPFAHLAITKN